MANQTKSFSKFQTGASVVTTKRSRLLWLQAIRNGSLTAGRDAAFDVKDHLGNVVASIRMPIPGVTGGYEVATLGRLGAVLPGGFSITDIVAGYTPLTNGQATVCAIYEEDA